MDILRGGWAPGLLGNGAGLRADSPSTGGTYSAEAMAIFAAFTTPPTDPRKALIDACVVALKSAGVWANLDALYAFAAADSQAAKINWIAPGTYNCTEVNAPAFVADRGFTGASVKAIDSTFIPFTAPTPKYIMNSASLFGWSLTVADTASGGLAGNMLSNNWCLLIPRQGNNFTYGVNVGVTLVANTDGSGFYAADRSASNLTTAYKNGVSVSTASVASSNVPTDTITFLARYAAYWVGGEAAAAGFGRSLDATAHTALYNALRTYMTGVGVP